MLSRKAEIASSEVNVPPTNVLLHNSQSVTLGGKEETIIQEEAKIVSVLCSYTSN